MNGQKPAPRAELAYFVSERCRVGLGSVPLRKHFRLADRMSSRPAPHPTE